MSDFHQAKRCLCSASKKSKTCNYLIWSDIVFDVQSKSLSLPVPQLFCSPVNALLSRCVNGIRGVIYRTCEKRYADLETSQPIIREQIFAKPKPCNICILFGGQTSYRTPSKRLTLDQRAPQYNAKHKKDPLCKISQQSEMNRREWTWWSANFQGIAFLLLMALA